MTAAARIAIVVLCALAAGLPDRLGAEESVHGADAVFRSGGLTLVWAVARQRDESKTAVAVRIIDGAKRFAALAVDGLDPFTKKRAALMAKRPLDGAADVAIPRMSFADLPQTEFHLYAAGAETPTLTIYYLGVPDTTPEFTDDAKLQAYLAQAGR